MLSRRRVAAASTGLGSSTVSHVVNTIVEERLAAFAPHHLPSLVACLDTDEVAAMVPEDLAGVEGLARQRTKTTHVLLLLCLHVGSGPPDCPRVEPCARLECWIDPLNAQMGRFATGSVSESIASALEGQYRTQQREATFKKAIEVHVDEARQLLVTMRRRARDGRVLIHYNGHGMPRATTHGEIWFLNKERTHYVPLNITEMAQLVDSPTLYVFDCNSAGSILQHWYKERMSERQPNDMIICACRAGELLPPNPLLPADVLTACLTTPLRMALSWYTSYSHRKYLLPHVTDDMIDSIPGDITDRRLPLGELNWILIAVTETIMWCTTPPAQFYQLFRQDTMTRALFRNFLLADRLMRGVGCVPISHPRVSEEAHLHHMWDLWDYTLENVICQLPELLTRDLAVNPDYTYRPSSFFTDQLMAFEVWVKSGDLTEQPEELPSVLRALMQISYRVPTLTLLVKYLDSGVIAGKRAILCGILPYASKLLVQHPEVFLIVSVLWMQIVRAAPAQGTAELLKTQSDRRFIRLLQLDEEMTKIFTVEDGLAAINKNVTGTGNVDATATTTKANAMNTNKNNKEDIVNDNIGTRSDRIYQQNFRKFSADSSVWMQPLQPVAGDTSQQHQEEDGQEQQQPQPQPQQPPETEFYLMRNVDLHRCKAMACYVLCQLLRRGGERQCVQSWNNQILNVIFSRLTSPSAEVRSWSCLVIAQLLMGLRYAKNFVARECTTHLDLFTQLLQDRSPIVRSSCVTLLASLVGVRVDNLPTEQQLRRVQVEKSLLIKLRSFIFDASMSVREELIFFASQVLYHYGWLVTPLATGSSSARFMNYILSVGSGAAQWLLDEPDVQVKSQLNASRPTVNSRFDHSVVFAVGFLSHDDPPPPPMATMDAAAVDPRILSVLQAIVHDAALMLFTLYQTCDSSKVTEAVTSLANGEAPQSHRFVSEAQRSMSHVVPADSSHFVSEADRARNTKNADSMRQLVLDLHDRRLEPQVSKSKTGSSREELHASGAAGDSSPKNSSGNDADSAAGHTGGATRCQVLRSLVNGDQVIAAAFRALEPAMVLATARRIVHVSYDTYSVQTQIHSFDIRLAAPLNSVVIINDLSEHAGLLLVSKRGGFSLVRSCWEESQGTPIEVAAFSACPPRGTLDIKCVYRPHNAKLLYGGFIGKGGTTEVHVLSMDEEQVVQRLEVSGSPTITSLTAHTTGRAVFAGCSDGVVRYYDDRQRQGFLGTVGLLSRRAAPSAPVEPIVGAGPLEGPAALMIATATRSVVRLYDSRKITEPTMEADVAALSGSHTGLASYFALGGKAPTITGFDTGVHTGMLGVLFSDGVYTAVNMRGQPLFERPMKVANTQGALLPSSCVVHPLRPLMTVGGELRFAL